MVGQRPTLLAVQVRHRVEMVAVLVPIAHPSLAAQVAGRGVIMYYWHPHFFLKASFEQHNYFRTPSSHFYPCKTYPTPNPGLFVCLISGPSTAVIPGNALVICSNPHTPVRPARDRTDLVLRQTVLRGEMLPGLPVVVVYAHFL